MKKKKNIKITTITLLAGAVLLTSCSSTSCFNPCNWKPGWKNNCKRQSECSDYQNSYDFGYSSYENDINSGDYNYGDYNNEDFNKGDYNEYNNLNYDTSNIDNENYQIRNEQLKAPKANPNNAYSPYPDTSVEDVESPRYIPEQPIDSKDIPYYNEKDIMEDTNHTNTSTPKNGATRQTQNDGPARQRNIPSQNEEQESPSIQKKDLDRIKSAHQRVLDRYKQKKTAQDSVSFEDSEYFDQIIKKVITKEQKS